jgi:hypothetical protein
MNRSRSWCAEKLGFLRIRVCRSLKGIRVCRGAATQTTGRGKWRETASSDGAPASQIPPRGRPAGRHVAGRQPIDRGKDIFVRLTKIIRIIIIIRKIKAKIRINK